MEATTSIAIVGAAGRMGDALATRMANLPYRLLLIEKGKEKLDWLKQKWEGSRSPVKIEYLECAVEGCWEADIIVLAVPAEAEAQIGETVREVATQKIIISLSNPRDTGEASKASAAEALQQVVPFSKVTKAFNLLSPQQIRKGGATVEIAGNEAEAVQTVMALATELGFKAAAHQPLSVCREWEQQGTIEEYQPLI